MRQLELLAPAKNLSVGIAAIDCGADAVYIAGSSFGARKDAGNSVEDIAKLCAYAHRYGARIFAAVNTLVYEHELSSVAELVSALQEAGVDALIVQDLSLLALAAKGEITVPLHASTQCAIRDVDSARRYAEAGFSRLILERQLSLREIRRIREATATTEVELECFVHGALCVCYSGQCYLSEALCERSANRGECVQACRSRYTLYDEKGRAMLKDKAVLSLKDLNLLSRLEDLAAEGVSSFKIEGRLKNESYVRNVVTAYSQALDAFVAAHPDEFQRASFGHVETKFIPHPDKTFNRGYTQLYLDGKKGTAGRSADPSDREGGWSSMDAPKGMGEYLGTVRHFTRQTLEVADEKWERAVLHPGDGLSFVSRSCDIEGFKMGDRPSAGLYIGARLYRNLDLVFEKQLAAGARRWIQVVISLPELNYEPVSQRWMLVAKAVSEDGRETVTQRTFEAPLASNQERMSSLFQSQLSKTTGYYVCRYSGEPTGLLPLLSVATLNELRRQLCEQLDAQAVHARPLHHAKPLARISASDFSYKANLSNSLAASVCRPAAGKDSESQVPINAFELKHQPDAELMRTRYCLRHELGLCPHRQRSSASMTPGKGSDSSMPRKGFASAAPLFLVNNGRRFRLDFDCPRCEMVLKAD